LLVYFASCRLKIRTSNTDLSIKDTNYIALFSTRNQARVLYLTHTHTLCFLSRLPNRIV
jgi:hypothetical protein